MEAAEPRPRKLNAGLFHVQQSDLEKIGALAVEVHIARQAYKNARRKARLINDEDTLRAYAAYLSAQDRLDDAIRALDLAPVKQ